MDKIILKFNQSPDDFYGHQIVTAPTHETYYIGPGTHPHYEILYHIEGNLEYIIEGETYKVLPEEMIFIASTEIHTLKIDGNYPFERAVILFNFNAFKSLLGRNIEESHSKYFEGENYLHIIPKEIVKKHRLKELMFSILESDKYGKYAQLHAVSKTLDFIIELDKVFVSNKVSFVQHPTIVDPFIKQVVSYIDEHITEPLMLDKIANSLFISKSTLCHRFNKHMNISLNRYITVKKINYARKLIYDGMSAAEASFAVGYENYTSFYYNYKQIFNAPPSADKLSDK